jgi:hypothetical protein
MVLSVAGIRDFPVLQLQLPIQKGVWSQGQNLIKYHAMKAYGGSGGTVLHILNLALGGGVWLALCLIIGTLVDMATLPVRKVSYPSLPPTYFVAAKLLSIYLP